MLYFDIHAHAALFDAIGLAGFGIYVLNYLALTFHIMRTDSALYFGMNLIAASCVMIGLIVSFNLASALIQGFWIALSIIGIVIRLRRPYRRETVSRTA